MVLTVLRDHSSRGSPSFFVQRWERRPESGSVLKAPHSIINYQDVKVVVGLDNVGTALEISWEGFKGSTGRNRLLQAADFGLSREVYVSAGLSINAAQIPQFVLRPLDT